MHSHGFFKNALRSLFQTGFNLQLHSCFHVSMMQFHFMI